MAAAAPRNMAPMHEWACALQPIVPAAGLAAPAPTAPVPVPEVIELPPAEGWALWNSLVAPATSSAGVAL